MVFILAWFCFYFLKEGCVLADEKCWDIEDVRLKKNGVIRCPPKSVIIVKDFKALEYYHCSRRFDKLQKLQKCNGIFNVCDMYVVDILTTIEEYVDSCYYSKKPQKVCIIYDCIPGPLNTLMDNTALTQAKGNLFQAVLHHGFLRCSFFGHITNITVPKSASEISVRDENGTEILCYTYGRFCTHYNDEWDSQIFSLTKEVKMNAIEMTVLTTDVFDITLGVEGGKYYKCQSDINYKQELEDELSATKGLNRSCTDGSNFKEQLQLTATILSTLLSLVLTGVYVVLCVLQRKNKQISLKTRSQLDPSSRRSLDNDYESLHDNMDAAV